jgi:hypothetical protein
MQTLRQVRQIRHITEQPCMQVLHDWCCFHIVGIIKGLLASLS